MKKDKFDEFLFLPTVIWRHHKENMKKCSLRGLEQRQDLHFITYPSILPPLEGYILLHVDAPVLTEEDRDLGLLLLDGTWAYAGSMERTLREQFHALYRTLVPRSLPTHLRTAYPRYQTLCPKPDQGLASVEALYAAYRLMGRDTSGLLDGYYWKQPFLAKNGFRDLS